MDPFVAISLFALIVDICSIYFVLTGRGHPAIKLIWIIAVVVMPLVGLLLYLLLWRGLTAPVKAK